MFVIKLVYIMSYSFVCIFESVYTFRSFKEILISLCFNCDAITEFRKQSTPRTHQLQAHIVFDRGYIAHHTNIHTYCNHKHFIFQQKNTYTNLITLK